MSRSTTWIVLALLVLISGRALAQNELEGTALFEINFVDDELDRFDSAGGFTSVDPSISGSVTDTGGKASASAFASYGLLQATAVMDPDIPEAPSFNVRGETSFSDTLTMGGSNVGEEATMTVMLHVTGLVQQPFVVSEVTGYAQTATNLSVGGSIDSNFDEAIYGVGGIGGPLYHNVDDTLIVTINFIVGEDVTLSASLDAYAEANSFNTAEEFIDFAALFGSSAELLPIELDGVVDPFITSASGTTYAIPEPAMLLPTFLVGLLLRRSRR